MVVLESFMFANTLHKHSVLNWDVSTESFVNKWYHSVETYQEQEGR